MMWNLIGSTLFATHPAVFQTRQQVVNFSNLAGLCGQLDAHGTGDQEVADLTPARSATSALGD